MQFSLVTCITTLIDYRRIRLSLNLRQQNPERIHFLLLIRVWGICV